MYPCVLPAAPTVEQIDGAVDWALAQKAAGLGVYVHCAHGHGRSNVVLSALLIAAGTVHDTPEVSCQLHSRSIWTSSNYVLRFSSPSDC